MNRRRLFHRHCPRRWNRKFPTNVAPRGHPRRFASPRRQEKALRRGLISAAPRPVRGTASRRNRRTAAAPAPGQPGARVPRPVQQHRGLPLAHAGARLLRRTAMVFVPAKAQAKARATVPGPMEALPVQRAAFLRRGLRIPPLLRHGANAVAARTAPRPQASPAGRHGPAASPELSAPPGAVRAAKRGPLHGLRRGRIPGRCAAAGSRL